MTDLFPTSPALIETLDALWGAPETWVANGDQWLHLEQVSATINRRVSGDSTLKPLGWFFQQISREQATPVARVMVIGCGTAEIELDVVRNGRALEAVGIDLSSRALARAAKAVATEGLAGVHHHQADMNALPIGKPDFEPGSYDAILGMFAIHHCENLEGLYAAVSRLLKPGGWFCLDEYIGPSRFQYPDPQIALVNGFLAALPDRLVMTRAGILKRSFVRPTPEQVSRVDPTEAIRSHDIVPLLARQFNIMSFRGYGGNLLQLVLADIAQHFQNDPDGALTRLIALEEQMLAEGQLTDDFAVIVARKRGA